MKKDKSKSKIIWGIIISRIQYIVGFAVAGFGLLGLIAGLIDPIVIITTLIGIFIFTRGMRRSKLIKTFRHYVSIISNDPARSLENIASATNTPLEKVRDNVDKMIKKGYFANTHIDESDNSIVIAGLHSPEKGASQQPQKATESSQPEIASNAANSEASPVSNAAKADEVREQLSYATVACRGCGAMNKVISGSIGECDFCGSHLPSEN